MKGRPVGPSMQNQWFFSKLWWNSMGTFIKTRLQSMYQNIRPACHPCAWWWILLDTTVSWRSWLDIIKIREPHGIFAKSISRQPMVLKNTYSGNLNSMMHGKKLAPIFRSWKKPINTPIYHNWLVETKPMGFFLGPSIATVLGSTSLAFATISQGLGNFQKRWQQHIGTSHRLHSDQEWFIYC